MKYGLVYFNETDNIGDDIQSYAVMKFLPQVDYLIDRETINEFVSDTGEPVAVILGGWFLHNKFNWPPSKDIYPLCTSLHFSMNDYMGIGYDFLNGLSGDYLKNYGPIGCRDSSTLAILQEKEIPAFLSGCATLTLTEREKKQQEKYICLVDVPEKVLEKVSRETSGTEIHIRQLTHTVNYVKTSLSWQERTAKVEELLDIYQNAGCVITKRLHCALPCLALRTPVLLLLDTDKDDVTRYSHFIDLLNVCSTEEFLNGESDFNLIDPPANKEDYLTEKNRLAESICEFVRQTQNNQIRESFQIWQQINDNAIYNWRISLLTGAAKYAAGQVDHLLREKNRIEAETFERVKEIAEQYDRDTNTLKQYLNTQEAENKRLDSIIAEKAAEEARLNQIILQKDQEITRINLVVHEKEKDTARINLAVQEKEKEIIRINGIITELNSAIVTYNTESLKQGNTILDQSNTISSLNDTISNLNGIILCLNDSISDLKRQLLDKEEVIEQWNRFHDEIQMYVRYQEEVSVSWLLFHSRTYKDSGIRGKLALLKKALFSNSKRKRHHLEDLLDEERI